MKLKNKDLTDMAKKLNEIAELESDEQFDLDQDASELREDLEAAVAGKGTEDGEPEIEIAADDDFTSHQWKVLAELGCPTALEESEEESDEEGEDEEETEEGEENDEDEDEITLEYLNSLTKKKDLKQVIEDNDLETDPSKFKKVDDLRNAIAEELELTEEEEGEEEGEEEEAEEGVTLEDLNKMTKKKDLKTVAEEYELEVDTSQKVDALRQEIAEKLELVEPEEDEDEEGEEDEGDAPSVDEIRNMKKKELKEVVEEHELEVDTDLKLNDLREEVVSAIHGEEEEGESEEESEEEEEGLTLEDLQGMTKKKELKQVIEDNDLETDPSEFKKVDDLRQAIAEELELVEPEEEGEEDEEDEEETPLSEVVQNTKKLGELKDLVKEHDEFKALRKKLNDYKGTEGRNSLKSKMLKKLGVEDTSSKKKSEGKKKEKGESKIKQIVNLILEEKRTPKELVEEAEKRDLSPSSMRSALSHCKKEDQLARYGMPEVIDKDDDGIIKLARNCKKNQKSSKKAKSSEKKTSGSSSSKKSSSAKKKKK